MIDWTQVLVAVLTGLFSGAAITAVWNGLKARADSHRADEHAHIEAADTISELSAEALQKAIRRYDTEIARYSERLAVLEDKCQRYESAFEAMRLDLIQARSTIAHLESENMELRQRVRILEEENAILHDRIERMESNPHGE